MVDVDERIVCSAIHYRDFPITVSQYMCSNIESGVVLCGLRHSHIIGQCISLLGSRQCEMGKYTQGFITTKNRFLNRQEAAILWKSQGNKLKYSQNELFSEDLY